MNTIDRDGEDDNSVADNHGVNSNDKKDNDE